MAIEKAGRSGSRNRDEMAPVGLTSAGTKIEARAMRARDSRAGASRPRKKVLRSLQPRERKLLKRLKKLNTLKKLNKSNKRKTLRITPDRRTASTGLPEAT